MVELDIDVLIIAVVVIVMYQVQCPSPEVNPGKSTNLEELPPFHSSPGERIDLNHILFPA